MTNATVPAANSSTRQLADFVSGAPIGSVPDKVLEAARDALIDTLGCGLAGVDDEPCRIAHLWISEQGGAAQAQVWGSDLRTMAADAAFANAIAAHALDFDDSSLNLRGHPSALMMSTAIAVGEAKHASGRRYLKRNNPRRRQWRTRGTGERDHHQRQGYLGAAHSQGLRS